MLVKAGDFWEKSSRQKCLTEDLTKMNRETRQLEYSQGGCIAFLPLRIDHPDSDIEAGKMRLPNRMFHKRYTSLNQRW